MEELVGYRNCSLQLRKAKMGYEKALFDKKMENPRYLVCISIAEG